MATIVPKPTFDAAAEAEKLHDAMKGAGTKESDLVFAFTKHSNEQLQEVRKAYLSAFGTELIDKIESETSGQFRRVCVALLKERVQLLADLLHDALAGAGTDVRCLVDVMAVLSADEAEAVKKTYKETYETDLEKDIRSDTTGNNEKTLCAILAAGRATGDDVDEAKAAEEAQELYDKGEGKAGTDNAYFRAIFCTRSWAQLRATLKAYNSQKDGHDIETAIEGEFSGNTRKLYLAMARFALDRASYFANILRECTEGLGTQDERLIYTIVTRAEIDLHTIKRKYLELFGEQLAVHVAGDTSGDYENVLIGLINGNQ